MPGVGSYMYIEDKQVRGDVITLRNDNLEKDSTPDYQEASEIFLGSYRLLQGSYTSFCRKERLNICSGARQRYSLLKEYLLQEPVLKLPDLSKPFVLRTDSSGVDVAAVLLHRNNQKPYPVDYTSKKLNLKEARYPIVEKECLVVVWGIKRFKL